MSKEPIQRQVEDIVVVIDRQLKNLHAFLLIGGLTLGGIFACHAWLNSTTLIFLESIALFVYSKQSVLPHYFDVNRIMSNRFTGKDD